MQNECHFILLVFGEKKTITDMVDAMHLLLCVCLACGENEFFKQSYFVNKKQENEKNE